MKLVFNKAQFEGYLFPVSRFYDDERKKVVDIMEIPGDEYRVRVSANQVSTGSITKIEHGEWHRITKQTLQDKYNIKEFT